MFVAGVLCLLEVQRLHAVFAVVAEGDVHPRIVVLVDELVVLDGSFLSHLVDEVEQLPDIAFVAWTYVGSFGRHVLRGLGTAYFHVQLRRAVAGVDDDDVAPAFADDVQLAECVLHGWFQLIGNHIVDTVAVRRVGGGELFGCKKSGHNGKLLVLIAKYYCSDVSIYVVVACCLLAVMAFYNKA